MLAALVCLGSLGLLAALLLGLAARRFAVAGDPREAAVLEVLAGANCGACGYPGCQAYARALVAGTAAPDLCRPAGPQAAAKIAGILGLSIKASEPRIAVVRCQGDHRRAAARYLYQGVSDCREAQELAGGPKLCPYGCLGLGSCVRACPFHAMTLSPDGLAVVDRTRCTGCGLCVAVCPRQVVTLAPASSHVHVLCNSHDRAAAQRRYCQAGCIGCRLCLKTAPESFAVTDNLAAVVYGNERPTPLAEAMRRCPAGCIRDLASNASSDGLAEGANA
jgi:electron transport complex protein RnfB